MLGEFTVMVAFRGCCTIGQQVMNASDLQVKRQVAKLEETWL